MPKFKYQVNGHASHEMEAPSYRQVADHVINNWVFPADKLQEGFAAASLVIEQDNGDEFLYRFWATVELGRALVTSMKKELK